VLTKNFSENIKNMTNKQHKSPKKTHISLFYLIKEFPFHFLFHYGFAALSAYRTSKLVDWAVKTFNSANSASLVKADFWPLLGGILLYGLVAYCHIALGIYCEEVFSSHLRKKLAQKLLEANFSQAQKEKFLLTRYDNDAFSVGTLASRIYNRSFFAVVSVFLVLKGFIDKPKLTGVIHWCLGFLAIMGGSAIILYWLTYRYHLKRNKRIEKENKYFKELNDNLEYVKISGAVKKETKKSNNLLENNLKKNVSFVLAKSTYATVPSYLLRYGIPLVFLYYYTGSEGAALYIQMNKVFGDAKTVIEMFWAHGGYDTYCTSLAQLNRSFQTLEKNCVKESLNLLAPIDKYGIKFQQVNFAYSPENKVLENFSFAFQNGKKYAIVGTNGIGKSTLFKLIVKLYYPQKGNIKLNENDLGKIENSALREKIIYLPNHPSFFNTDLGNNIVYPDTYQETIHQKKLENIAKKLGIKEFIDKLPNRWKTIIAEKGQNLSEGQKQLISLMRAFAKDYEIYLFDEFLSNVSKDLKEQILQVIFHELRNKTIIIISHDPEVLQHVDEKYTFTKQGLIK
jgi:ABC-type multidrug transport system fused ATPase/permease subunit